MDPELLKLLQQLLPSFILSQEKIADALARIAKAQEEIVLLARDNSKTSNKSLKTMTNLMKDVVEGGECRTCNSTKETGCEPWCHTKKFPCRGDA